MQPVEGVVGLAPGSSSNYGWISTFDSLAGIGALKSIGGSSGRRHQC
jgi:hypothetical protein